MKKVLVFLLVFSITLISIYFINATTNDFDKQLSGSHQIKNHQIALNSKDEAEVIFNLTHATNSKINPSITVHQKGALIYQGERKVKDTSLGEYIIEVRFTDTNFQDNAKLSFEKEASELQAYSQKASRMINNMKITYPPDDSMLIIYIGVDQEPVVTLEEFKSNIRVKINSKVKKY